MPAVGSVLFSRGRCPSRRIRCSSRSSRTAADAALAGRNVVIVDDGVETGTVARAAATAMVESGVASVVLAVPVCSRESMASLQHRHDQIVTLVRPMVHRSLSWHFTDFDTIDEATARRQLADLPGE